MHDIPETIANNCHSSTVIWTIWKKMVDFQTRMEPAFCHLLLCVIRQEVLHGLDGGSQMAGVFHGNSQCQFHFLVCKCLEVSFHHIWEHNKKGPSSWCLSWFMSHLVWYIHQWKVLKISQDFSTDAMLQRCPGTGTLSRRSSKPSCLKAWPKRYLLRIWKVSSPKHGILPRKRNQGCAN